MQVGNGEYANGLIEKFNEKARKKMLTRLNDMAWELAVLFHIPKDNFYQFISQEMSKQEESCK